MEEVKSYIAKLDESFDGLGKIEDHKIAKTDASFESHQHVREILKFT